MKGGYVELSVYLACLSFILNFYASFVALLGVVGHLLMFLSVSCILFCVLLRFRIPRPKDCTVRSIFGSNWGAYASLGGNDPLTGNDYVMKVVAHRACGLDAPENSLSALDKISKEGVTAVEFDVLMTADDVPVVFHDVSLSRMTHSCKNVRETTYEEIKKLDISLKHPFGKNFRGEKIPTLHEYVAYCLENKIRMFIDLKDGKNDVASVINEMFKQNPKLYEAAVVSSFDPVLIYNVNASTCLRDGMIRISLPSVRPLWRPDLNVSFTVHLLMNFPMAFSEFRIPLGFREKSTSPAAVDHPEVYDIRAKDPDIACSLAWRPYFYSHEEYSQAGGPRYPRTGNLLNFFLLRILDCIHQWALWKFGYYLLGLSALLLHKDIVTRETICYWHKRGVRVIAWSVNLPTEKQYFEKILEITYLTDTTINS